MKKLYNKAKNDLWVEQNVCMSVIARYGTGGGNVPIVVSYGFKPRNGSDARSIGYEKEIAPTLNKDADCGVGILINELPESDRLSEPRGASRELQRSGCVQ